MHQFQKQLLLKVFFSENDNACPKEHPVPYGGYCCTLIEGTPVDSSQGISQNDLCNLLTYLLNTNNTEETCINCPNTGYLIAKRVK